MSSELEDLQSSRKRFGLEHREGDLCWSLSVSEGRKEKAECHLRRGDGLGNEEMRVLRGVVYMTKSSGPRTEPWGTPQEEVCQEDRSVSHFTRKQRDDK